METEKRTTRNVQFKIESRGEGDAKKEVIRGHAAMFGVAADIGSFIEEIETGFFSEALKVSDPRSLFNHNENYVLGRMSAGTLNVSEDGLGLLSETEPPDTQWARDLMTSMKRGDIKEMSFSFQVKRKENGDDMDGDQWRKLPGGGSHRTLLAGGCKYLFDTSVVTYPAYEAANDVAVAQRSMQRWQDTHPENPPAPPVDTAAEDTARASQAEGEARRRALEMTA